MTHLRVRNLQPHTVQELTNVNFHDALFDVSVKLEECQEEIPVEHTSCPIKTEWFVFIFKSDVVYL